MGEVRWTNDTKKMHSLTKITFLINIISHTSLIESSRCSVVTVTLETLLNYIETQTGINGCKFDLKKYWCIYMRWKLSLRKLIITKVILINIFNPTQRIIIFSNKSSYYFLNVSGQNSCIWILYENR